ncbi:FAD-dependent oxidoreductase [Cypionkella psychrotolerans]|uniref:FAD-dependent oxidoreductase n=1 Tax=Cypionkella psychrotolerans TaxID=1678131 RepID=UPI0006B65480|nr:FAD-dependent oxidoreductase [Cypionkella psychrotolerans]
MITVLGMGGAGLCAATALTEAGLAVQLAAPQGPSASHLAGGMLAPFCEAEAAPALVTTLGRGAAGWWEARVPGVHRCGTLVIAPPRDGTELRRFASRSTGHQALDGTGITALEPALAGRFSRGLFFADEAHLDPRAALAALAATLRAKGVAFDRTAQGQIVDCRGIAARDRLPALRAVRGEMLLLRCPDLTLSRPIRLLHPRFPCYLVPRGKNTFMLGATMVESDHAGPITARSTMELLSAAFAIHPTLAEAEIIETGAGLRPAYADNIPTVQHDAGRWHLNGLYRHGFLLAPALAQQLAARLTIIPEPIHAD